MFQDRDTGNFDESDGGGRAVRVRALPRALSARGDLRVAGRRGPSGAGGLLVPMPASVQEPFSVLRALEKTFDTYGWDEESWT
jgi:hypothetical protein